MSKLPHIQIDEQVINDRLEDLHHATQELERFQSMDIESFRANEDAISIASRSLYESLESIVAVETYLLECFAQQETSQNDKQDRKQTKKTPNTSLLVDQGILPKDLSQRMKGIKQYRDRMAHEYWKIQPEELLQMTQKGLPDFKEFEKQIRNSFSLGSNSFLTNASLLSLILAVTIIGSFFFFQKDPQQSEAALTVNSPVPNNASITNGLVGHWTFDGPDTDWSSTGTEIKDPQRLNNVDDALVSDVSPNHEGTDGVDYEMGMKFQSDTDGYITAIRYYKPASDTGTHTGRIWSAGGTQLASVTFSSETSSGWQEQPLATPLSISASTTYVVSVNTANEYYDNTEYGLDSQITQGHLSTVVGSNGVYGTAGTFPTSSYHNANYFRDVVFSTTDTYTPYIATFSGDASTSGMDKTNAVPGVIGQGMSFDGSSNYVDLGDLSVFTDLDERTYCLWIKNSTITAVLLSKTVDGSNWFDYFFIDSGSIGYNRSFSGGNALWETSAILSTGEWQHVCMTYDQTDADNDPVFYYNGMSQSLSTDSNSTGTAYTNSGGNLYIGQDVFYGEFFSGDLDDVRIYDRILSAEEIQSLYQLGH